MNLLWGDKEVQWIEKDAQGRSGGLIILWKYDLFESLFSFSLEGFMGINVEWKEKLYYIMNVYSSCCIMKKRKIWSESIDLKNKFPGGLWGIGGDFNVVTKGKEQKEIRSVSYHLEML